MARPRAYSYIRMSTDLQLKGDSLRRQLDQSRKYAEAQGWDLLEDDQLRDIGISAFSGANVTEGALGRFLEAVRKGKVEPGSFLLVESLDRLSRQEVLKSLSVFIEILNAGVNIVTLADGRTYTPGTKFEDLMFSLVSMSRAHDESRTKSHRLKAAWSNKRKNAESRKLTAQCPGWLSLSKDKTSFVVVQERADVVVSIFRESAAGIGNYSITRRLNRDHVSPFGRSKGWHTSSVAKILANHAVLGEFQPHRLVDGKRVPEGDPLKTYYPAIVDENLFFRAQHGRSQRRVNGAGRKGENISNLFSGLAICAYCKSPMRFENKGAGPKGGTRLVCDAARRGLGCEKTAWRYRDFEASFLSFVSEVDLTSILRADVAADLDTEIAALSGRLDSVKTQRDRVLQLFIDRPDDAPEFVRRRLDDFERQRVKLEAEIRTKEQTRANLKAEARQVHEVKAAIARLQNSIGEEVYELRSRVAARLRTIVVTIQVAPVGNVPNTRRVLKSLEGEPGTEDYKRYFLERLRDKHEQARFFIVAFKDQSSRQVYPSDNDPMQFEEQLLSSEDKGLRRVSPTFEEVPRVIGTLEERIRQSGPFRPKGTH